MSDKPVLAQPGNAALRKEVGPNFSIAAQVTESRIQSCETMLKEAGDAFFTDASPDLVALEALAHSGHATLDTEKLATHTYNIRSFAKVLGFVLITEICVHLVAVIDSTELTEKKRRLLIAKLVEALRFAFTSKIRGDGGNAGQELLNNLRAYL